MGYIISLEVKYNMPYKKMENVNKFGFWAKCECGYIHKFKSSEINLKTSNGNSIEFNNVYECPQCGQIYDGISENKSNRKHEYSIIGLLITFILVVGIGYGGYQLLNSIFTPTQTVDYNHATNKQIDDFNKWQQKQEQQKWENSPAFPNNK
jgi:hypothetical protein